LVTRLANGPRTLVVGEIDEAQADALRALGMSVPDAGVRNRTAESLARIGHSRWLAGCVDNPVTLEPIYVHQRGG
jgi:hypothetical protein